MERGLSAHPFFQRTNSKKNLKGAKCEIFYPFFYTLINSIWDGLAIIFFMTTAYICHFVFLLFGHAEYALKIAYTC
jgi:hypothetical protein